MLRGCGSIIIRNNKVLLMYRTNVKFFNNMWSNPGGKVEDDESLEEACIRETKEELGVDCKVIQELSTYPFFHEDKLFGEFTGFLVEAKGVPKIMEPDKTRELEYHRIINPPKPIAPYTVQYLRDLGYEL